VFANAHQNELLPCQVFSLCYASISLDVTAASLGQESRSKLQKQLKNWEPLVGCQDVFDLLNKLETLGVGPLFALISLHGIGSSFRTKDLSAMSSRTTS
jgi:hypothetical protein